MTTPPKSATAGSTNAASTHISPPPKKPTFEKEGKGAVVLTAEPKGGHRRSKTNVAGLSSDNLKRLMSVAEKCPIPSTKQEWINDMKPQILAAFKEKLTSDTAAQAEFEKNYPTFYESIFKPLFEKS